MPGGQPPRVKGLPGELAQDRRQRLIRDLLPARFAIGAVADQWPSTRRQVHADLMRSPGHEAAPKQRQTRRRRRHACEALESREAGRAQIRGGHNAAAIAGVAPEAEVDVPARDVHLPVDDGQVVLRRGTRRQHSLQRRVDGGRLGHQHDAGGQLVEATRQGRTLRGRPPACMPQQRVHQRPGRVLVCRMHHQAGGLVDGKQVIVFVEDCERDVFSRHPHGWRQGQATATTSPNAVRTATRRTAVPLTVTSPLSIHACTRVLVAARTSVKCRRSTRSSRCPASPRSAFTMRQAASVIGVYRIAGPTITMARRRDGAKNQRNVAGWLARLVASRA